MEKATLRSFLRTGLDILFVGLNPAKGSNDNGHYFSVNAAFWNQLFSSGLLCRPIDKKCADSVVFGTADINKYGWNYGITDLVTTVVESNSNKVRVTNADCQRLIMEISDYCPRTAVLLHSRVRDKLSKYLGIQRVPEQGDAGKWIAGLPTEFFIVPFPHGNSKTTKEKVDIYKQVTKYLESL